MRHKFLLILPILLIVAMSGCVSDADKANLVIIDGNLTDYSLNYWSHFAKVSSEQLFQSKGQYMQFDYSTICPLHPYTGEASDTFDSMYYVSECDPAKIAELKTSDNGTFKEAYISLSEIKAVSAISKRINSTFYNIYSQNTVSNSDSVETVILDIANKTIDVTMMLPMISGMGDVWLFMTSGGVQGIQTGEMSKCWDSTTKEYSNTCLDTFFSKMESASPQIIQSTSFGSDFITSCKAYLNRDAAAIQELRKGLLDKLKNTANPDSYMNLDKVCQRARDVYSQMYNGLLNGISEPTERFVVASVFYRVSHMGDTAATFSSSLGQMLQ